MIHKPIKTMTRGELREYLYEIQNHIETELEKGIDIDDFLDKTIIFDEFENLIPDEEFSILIITILNGFKSDVIIEKLLDVIEESKRSQ